MKVSTEDIRRIELIPESDEEKAVLQNILDGEAIIYWATPARTLPRRSLSVD